jgi:hypothetical protein
VAKHSVHKGKKVLIVATRDNYLLGLFEGVQISKSNQVVGQLFDLIPYDYYNAFCHPMEGYFTAN